MGDSLNSMEWKPAQLLSTSRDEGRELRPGALLILNQPIESLNLLKAVWKNGMQSGLVIIS